VTPLAPLIGYDQLGFQEALEEKYVRIFHTSNAAIA
jgi:hypothetical protein